MLVINFNMAEDLWSLEKYTIYKERSGFSYMFDKNKIKNYRKTFDAKFNGFFIETENSSVPLPYPSELDVSMITFLNEIMAETIVSQQEIRKQFSANHSLTFLHFGFRMSIHSVRTNSKELLMSGITAVVFEGCEFDYRESLITLSVLKHSAGKLKLKYKKLLNELDNNILPENLAAIKRFTYSVALWNISAVGMKESQNEDGFTYTSI